MFSFLRHPVVGRSLWVLAACSLVAVGSAQTVRTILPVRQVEVKRAVVQNTYNVYPQIQVVKGPFRDVEQNEADVPPRPAGKPNGLVAGQVAKMARVDMSTTRMWPAIGATGWVPPDCTAAVGPDYVVATVNSDLAFFTRAGTKLFQQGLGPNAFFSGVATVDFVYDPKCFYDPLSQRFFVVALEEDTAKAVSGLLLAVSSGPDPRGNWMKYRIDSKMTIGSTSYWLDYPGFGYNKDRVVICGNMFGFSSGWAGVQVFSLDKSKLISGSTANSSVYNLPDAGSVQWCKSRDASSNVLYGASVSSGSSISLFAIQGTETSNAPMKTTEVQVPQFRSPNSARSTSNHVLDALDARLLTMGYQSGHIVASHGVRNMTQEHVVSRWYDFATSGWPASGTPKLNQAGEVAGASGEDYFMPAIHINGNGDMGMVFTRSSAAITADLMVTGRKASDPKGTMGTPARAATSDSVYGGSANRWGDYFSVEIDPKDSRSFWGIGMVSRGGEWSTQVWNWAVSTNGIYGAPYDAIAVGVYQNMGQIVSGTYRELAAADGNGVIVASSPISGTGQVAAPAITYATDVTPSTVVRVGLSIAYSGPVSGTVLVSAYNVTTGKWDYVGTATGSTAGNAFVPFSSTVKLSNYFAGNGQVKVIARYVVPTRNGVMPTSYSYKVDVARLMIEANN